MTETTKIQTRILFFLRLESNTVIKRTLIGSLFGILTYLFSYMVEFPQYTFFGIDLGITTLPIKGGIDLSIVVVVLIAAFCGPLAGFIVGFFGSLGADILYTHQFIVLGTINIAFGVLGFIVGIPRYTQNEGFADGKKIAQLLGLIFLGFIIMILIYLVALLVVANQSLVATLLYNFLPYFSIWIISLFFIAPVVVRICEIVIDQFITFWASRTETG